MGSETSRDQVWLGAITEETLWHIYRRHDSGGRRAAIASALTEWSFSVSALANVSAI